MQRLTGLCLTTGTPLSSDTGFVLSRTLLTSGVETELQPYQPGMADNDAWHTLRTTWRKMRYRCKVTVSVSVVSEHRTSGELRYYHASLNNIERSARQRRGRCTSLLTLRSTWASCWVLNSSETDG